MSKVAESILEFDGPTPRVVADLQEVDFEFQHIRDDVVNQYSEGDLNMAYRLIMANQVSGEDFKHIVGGEQYHAQTLFFDNILVFLFSSDRYNAVFASDDYDEDFPVNQLVQEITEATGR